MTENDVNIEEQKIGQYFCAEGLIKDLNSGKGRQFHNLLQLQISANSLTKNFSVLPTYSTYISFTKKN